MMVSLEEARSVRSESQCDGERMNTAFSKPGCVAWKADGEFRGKDS